MSAVVAPRDVRVTARKSITAPFVAPDLSPVQPHLAIDDQGSQGWTDFDVKLDLPRADNHRPAGMAERSLAQMSCGTARPPRRRQPKPLKLK